MIDQLQQRYLTVKNNIAQLAQACGRSPQDVTLVVVTKNHLPESIARLYDTGCRHFGENRVQEALPKISQLPADIRWHLIGTLQTNKVAKVVPSFCLIHSVDRLDVARRLSAVSEERRCSTPILLQVNTSGEATKQGFTEQECRIAIEELRDLPGVRLEGLMTIAPFTQDQKCIRLCFKRLRNLRDELQLKIGPQFHHLSMGMSHDYPIAIEEGATLLRIGTAILGERPLYTKF